MSDDDGGWLTDDERARQRESVQRTVDRLQMTGASDEQKVRVVLIGQAVMVVGLVAAAWASGGSLLVVIPVLLLFAVSVGATIGIAKVMRADGSPHAANYQVWSLALALIGIVGSLWAMF